MSKNLPRVVVFRAALPNTHHSLAWRADVLTEGSEQSDRGEAPWL